MASTILIRSPGVASAPSMGKFRRDPVCKSDNGGVRFLFDLCSTSGWPTQTAPVDTSVVPNLATTTGVMTLGDGSTSIAAGQTVAYAGGGFDFTGLTDDPAAIVGPSNSLASIAGATDDYFMVVIYLKMAAGADWISDGSTPPFFCCTSHVNGYLSEADMLTIMTANAPSIIARRQTNGGSTVVSSTISANVAAYFQGKMTQLVYYRNAGGVRFQARSVDGISGVGTSLGSNNSGDFSAKQPRFGVPDSVNSLASNSAQRLAHKTRFYRGWIEDLSLSGRNPLVVADEDWQRVQDRIAASAAANGGNSLIFV